MLIGFGRFGQVVSSEQGRKFFYGNLPKPEPLIEPKRESKVLNPGGSISNGDEILSTEATAKGPR
jgi:hypothetical protein